MDHTSLFDILNSHKVVLAAGFASGFVYAFKFTKRTLDYPLTTIFNSAASGLLTLWGTSLFFESVPDELRFIIPLTVGASCLYWKYNDLFHNKKDKPFFQFKYTTTTNNTNNTTNVTVGSDSSDSDSDSDDDAHSQRDEAASPNLSHATPHPLQDEVSNDQSSQSIPNPSNEVTNAKKDL